MIKGYKILLHLTLRLFFCQACGQVSDRDRNAAQNILKEVLRLVGERQKGKIAHGAGSDGAEKSPVDVE